MGWVIRYVREDDGVDIVEYALIAAIVAVGCMFAMKDLRLGITEFLGRVSTGLTGIF
jgi:Flp pilus assembly pilin Flp